MNVRDKISKARAQLVLSQPFFGTLALKMKIRESDQVETMGTNGTELVYNPAFVDPMPLRHLIGVLAHEVMHCACLHQTRQGNRDPKLWNVAADYAINQILVDSGFELPDSGLIDPAYRGLSAETIYEKIKREQNPDMSGQGNDPGGCGQVMPAPANGPAELSQIETDWQIATLQAANAAKAAGNLPGDIERMVEELRQSKTDWREVLRDLVRSSARSDYTWIPPNRRHIYRGLYLPSIIQEGIGPIVVAVDTSASIDQDSLDQFAAEINAIFEDCAPEIVHVVYCDHVIRHAESFGADDFPVTLKSRGGGGTRFSPVFRWAEDQEIDPTALVYLTDLQCHDFGPEPDYPVIWASTDLDSAPFGQVVQVEL